MCDKCIVAELAKDAEGAETSTLNFSCSGILKPKSVGTVIFIDSTHT